MAKRTHERETAKDYLYYALYTQAEPVGTAFSSLAAQAFKEALVREDVSSSLITMKGSAV